MLNKLKSADQRVVGLKQLLRELDKCNVKIVYLALNADAALQNEVTTAAEKAGAELVLVEKMEDLGEICAIDVAAACAGILKSEPS